MYFAAGHWVPTKTAGPNSIIIRCFSLEDSELILSESKKLWRYEEKCGS